MVEGEGSSEECLVSSILSLCLKTTNQIVTMCEDAIFVKTIIIQCDVLYILVKALVRVQYGKYCTRVYGFIQ